jgi:hypothetical protein
LLPTLQEPPDRYHPGVSEGSSQPPAETALVVQTTALAEQTPAALAHAPSYFPTGHADSGTLFAILIGAPLAAGVGLAALASVFGLEAGSVMLGIFGAPLGLWGANHYFEHRGKQRLAQALRLHALEPGRGRMALELLSATPAVLPEIRLEAAARVALDAFEAGDIASAIKALTIGEQDIDRPRRRRNWQVGLRAEVLRAILAWLSPDSFTDCGVAPRKAFSDDGADPQGVALLAALQLLETASLGDDGALAAAWNDVEASPLEQMLPTLYVLVQAVASQRLEHLVDPLRERLRHDPDGKHRQFLHRLFPRMHLDAQDGYRGVSQDPPERGEHTSLEVIAPQELTELARLEGSELMPLTRGTAAKAFLKVYASFALGGMIVAGTSGGALLLGAFTGLIAGLYMGTPIAAIWGSRLTQRDERARRVAPLIRLQPTPPGPWLVECASGPPGGVTQTSGYRRLTDLPASQMVLYAAAHKAEVAIEAGDLDEAWSHVAWWFAGFSGALASTDPMYAVGTSLVRVAALTGHLEDARRLLRVIPEVGHAWDSPVNRTGNGNSPRALSLVGALLEGLEGRWDNAARLLEVGGASKPIYLGGHVQSLYAELARRTTAHGESVDWRYPPPDPNHEDWLRVVLPDTATAIDEIDRHV